MNWQTAAALGACGGAIFSLFPPWLCLLVAHEARRDALRVGKPLPPLREFFDLAGDALVVIARTAFGAIAGAVFHTQLTGGATAGAIAIGASAPILLKQLGNVRAISDAVIGSDPPETQAPEDARQLGEALPETPA